MEGTHNEEICKRINYSLCTMTSLQVKHSQDAVRIKRIRAQNNRFFPQTVGGSTLPWKDSLRSVQRKFGREIG